MARLEICLLGGFELGREGRILDPLPLRAARSLFAYLVLNRDRAHTRDLIAGTLWPDFDEPRARRRLSQALWQIRSTVGDENDRYLIGTPDTIRFNPDADFSLDVLDFEQHLEDAADAATRAEEAASLEAAVDLYKGDLLAGFYDDWLLPDQDRLRSRFLGALERVAELAQSRGDFEAALVIARRLAQEDEFDEESHRRVMRLAVLLGRHNEAIRQYEECRRILAAELGSTPSAETVELYEATLVDRESGGRPLPAHDESPLFGDAEQSPFVGRDAERSRLAQRLDEVLDGNGGVVLIEGESGVGKTRLLAEVVADARWRGMDVLWGRSAPSGGRPFAPLSEALNGVAGLRAKQVASRLPAVWADVLAPLVPGLGPGTESTAEPAGPVRRADEQSRMREAIAEAFHTLATLGPTLVVLEDVHWADDDTIAALTQLAGRIASDRILFAVSYRHGEARERSDVWELLRALDRMPHCERVSLAPLSPAQTEELIRHSLGRAEVSGDFSESLHRDTGGIPLFIVETLRALYERDALDEADTPAESSPPTRDRIPVTPRVHALIRQRLDSLDPLSRRTLELVAAHDGTLLLEEIVEASDLEDDAALASVDDLARRRFLSGREREYSLGHELMRRVIYDDLPTSRRLDLHRRVALGIERHRPDEVEVLAHHFATARMPDRAAEYLERAARRAMAVHAYDTASLHLDRASAALDDIGAPNERRYAIAALLEEVLDVLGRRTEQEEALRRLQRFASDEDRGDVHRRRAWWLSHQDRFQEAEEEAERALASAHQAGDSGQIVSALTALGMIACFGGRAAEGVRHLEEAAGFRGTDRRQEADARNALGQNLIDLQRFGEAESQLLAALALYGELEDRRGQAEVLGMLGTLRMERGEPEAAESDFLKAIDISKEIGYRHGEAVYEMNLAILYVITNRLGSALESFETAADTYALMGNRRGQALVQSNAAWMRHSRLGEDDRARDSIFEALLVYEEIGDRRGEAQCLGMLGSIEARAGNGTSAWSHFETAVSIADDVKDQWLAAQILREYASSELAAERVASALGHIERAERICAEIGMDDLAIGVRSLKGRILLELGDADEALRETGAAAEMMRPGIELAHLIHYAHGLALHSVGEHGRSQQQFETAYAVLMQIVSDLPPDKRQRALEQVPEHVMIVDWWRSKRPVTAAHRVAALDAPTGRALRPDEFVNVVWTISEPADLDIPDKVERRHHRIRRLLDEANAQGASPTVGDLANALSISEATIRRDLLTLRKDGNAVATRGSRLNAQRN